MRDGEVLLFCSFSWDSVFLRELVMSLWGLRGNHIERGGCFFCKTTITTPSKQQPCKASGGSIEPMFGACCSRLLLGCLEMEYQT